MRGAGLWAIVKQPQPRRDPPEPRTTILLQTQRRTVARKAVMPTVKATAREQLVGTTAP